jgi:hypothetical protein
LEGVGVLFCLGVVGRWALGVLPFSKCSKALFQYIYYFV